MRWHLLPLTLLLIVFTLPVVGATPDYRDLTLPNGLRVILWRDTKAPVVSTQVWYRVGAVYEPPGKTGLAHMLEHMMFQGTTTLAPNEYSKIVARNGGEDNASTSLDYTNYYINLAADRLEQALRLEADTMRNLKLRRKEFLKENQVVREERRERTDSDPDGRMSERFYATVFQVHPYRRPVIGYMEDIAAHTLADLNRWYRAYYAPNNATLVIVGDIEFAKAESLVNQYFAPLPPHPALTRPPLPEEPPQTAPRRLEVRDPGVTVTRWMAGYVVPTLAHPTAGADGYALDLLVTILGDGTSSRLHRRLVTGDQLAVAADASYGGLSSFPEIFHIEADVKSGVDPVLVEKAVLDEVARLAREPVGGRELDKARNGLIADQIYARDSIQHTAWLIGRYVTSGVDWKAMLEYPAKIRAVTAEQVRRVAARYLDPRRITVGVLQPEQVKSKDGAKEGFTAETRDKSKDKPGDKPRDKPKDKSKDKSKNNPRESSK